MRNAYLFTAYSLALLVSATILANSERVPKIEELGDLQIIKYNHLDSKNGGPSAVLSYDFLTWFEGADRCAMIGESLYALTGSSQASYSELDFQFDYLMHTGDLNSADLLWVAGGDERECYAYSPALKKTAKVSCYSRYRTLCTSHVPPTTDRNRSPTLSSRISITAGDYAFTGYRDARSFRFLGIPFADPPVNELRFMPPNPYTGPREIEATIAPNACIQPSSPEASVHENVSEDCLYLNVYTPILPSRVSRTSLRRPVAVYFYGGTFTKGSSGMIDYDGGNFASRQDLVIVTVNYRVGALGFLSTGKLTTGNYGVRDQILALEWVNKHISVFGGDPSQITIFGQSAGGQSVIALLSSSAAKGLFTSAIIQSAPIDLPWLTQGVYEDLITPYISTAVGCGHASDDERTLLSCLRAVPSSNYLGNTTSFQSALSTASKRVASEYLQTTSLLANIEPLMPSVENSTGVIDNQFHILLSNNTLPSRVPVMFTSVPDEAALFVGNILTSPLGNEQTTLDNLLRVSYPSLLAENIISSGVFQVNGSDPDSVRNTCAKVLTHSEWLCPQAYILEHGAKCSFPKLYKLKITKGHTQSTVEVPEICHPNSMYNATCHSADVLPTWGTLNSKTQDVIPYYDHEDVLNSQILNDIFGQFIRTQNPNPDPEWIRTRGPAYRATYELFMEKGYHISEYGGYKRGFGGGINESSKLKRDIGFGVPDNDKTKCKAFDEYGYTFQRAGKTGAFTKKSGSQKLGYNETLSNIQLFGSNLADLFY